MTTEAKKTRTPSLTMSEKFTLMTFIKGAPKDTPDRTLAAQAAEKIGRPVSPQTVTNYRKELGLQSVAMPSREELQETIEALQTRIELQRQRIETLMAQARIPVGDAVEA